MNVRYGWKADIRRMSRPRQSQLRLSVYTVLKRRSDVTSAELGSEGHRYALRHLKPLISCTCRSSGTC